MTSVLLLSTPDPGAPALANDFAAAGFDVCGSGECAHLVRETLRAAPDVLVCWAPRPTTELLQSLTTLQAQQAVPVVFFTQDAGVEMLQAALDAGVHAWVVQGYARERLRPLVHLAQAREQHERQLRTQLSELGEKLEERRWVDRAKGILMHAQHVSEEQAFQWLRSASMQGKQRVGQLSRQVIAAARIADAINRAGQQRMLSQRLVKLHALACSRTDAPAVALLVKESVQRVEDNLAALAQDLSEPTYGDLVASAQAGWKNLHALLAAAPQASSLAALDAAAEKVLAQADALVLALESSGLAPQVHVVNLAGRQRMLSQRMAKLALLQGVAIDAVVAQRLQADTAAEFEEGLRALGGAPLSSPEIGIILGRGERAWQELRAAVSSAPAPADRMRIAAASEELLEIFEQLTAAYQHSVQVLVGG